MAQLIVRNLEDEVRDKLRALALQHGRSMEEEIREILRGAVLDASSATGPGLGTEISELFADHGLEDPIREFKGQPTRPADFEP